MVKIFANTNLHSISYHTKKRRKKRSLSNIVLVLSVVAIAVSLYLLLANKGYGKIYSEVSIKKIENDRIIYKMNEEVDQSLYAKDCQKRNGYFDPCIKECGTSDEICLQKCVYACDFEKRKISKNFQWKQYIDEEVGFRLSYPDVLQVKKRPGGSDLIYWGSEQRKDTELYDGISISVKGVEITPTSTLESYIAGELDDANIVGEILSDLQVYVLNDRLVYHFKARIIGVMDKVYIPMDHPKYQAIEVTYSAPDPRMKGYKEVVMEVIDSLRITNTYE